MQALLGYVWGALVVSALILWLVVPLFVRPDSGQDAAAFIPYVLLVAGLADFVMLLVLRRRGLPPIVALALTNSPVFLGAIQYVLYGNRLVLNVLALATMVGLYLTRPKPEAAGRP